MMLYAVQIFKGLWGKLWFVIFGYTMGLFQIKESYLIEGQSRDPL